MPIWPVRITRRPVSVFTIDAGFKLGLCPIVLLDSLAIGALGVTVVSGTSAGLAHMAGLTV